MERQERMACRFQFRGFNFAILRVIKVAQEEKKEEKKKKKIKMFLAKIHI